MYICIKDLHKTVLQSEKTYNLHIMNSVRVNVNIN